MKANIFLWKLKTCIRCALCGVIPNFLAKSKKKKNFEYDPFKYVGKNEISNDKMLQDVASSWYSVVKSVAVIGIMLTFFVAAMLLLLSSRSEKRAEAKRKILTGSGIFIAICGFSYLIGQIASIVSDFL